MKRFIQIEVRHNGNIGVEMAVWSIEKLSAIYSLNPVKQNEDFIFSDEIYRALAVPQPYFEQQRFAYLPKKQMDEAILNAFKLSQQYSKLGAVQFVTHSRISHRASAKINQRLQILGLLSPERSFRKRWFLLGNRKLEEAGLRIWINKNIYQANRQQKMQVQNNYSENMMSIIENLEQGINNAYQVFLKKIEECILNFRREINSTKQQAKKPPINPQGQKQYVIDTSRNQQFPITGPDDRISPLRKQAQTPRHLTVSHPSPTYAQQKQQQQNLAQNNLGARDNSGIIFRINPQVQPQGGTQVQPESPTQLMRAAHQQSHSVNNKVDEGLIIK